MADSGTVMGKMVFCVGIGLYLRLATYVSKTESIVLNQAQHSSIYKKGFNHSQLLWWLTDEFHGYMYPICLLVDKTTKTVYRDECMTQD